MQHQLCVGGGGDQMVSHAPLLGEEGKDLPVEVVLVVLDVHPRRAPCTLYPGRRERWQGLPLEVLQLLTHLRQVGSGQAKI